MKQRRPGTFEDAIMRVVAALGAEEAGAAAGKSASLVYKWADFDADAKPSVHQALALDTAYVTAGLGEAPICRAYRHRIAMLRAAPHDAADPAARFMDVIREAGELSAEIRAASEDRRWTPRERDQALAAVAGLRAELDKLERDIEALDGVVPIRAEAR